MFLIIIQQNIYCVARCFFIQGHWVWCWMNYSKNMKNDECISELMFMLQNKSIVLNCSFHHVQRNKKWGVEFCLQHYLLVRILRLIFIPTFSLIIKKNIFQIVSHSFYPCLIPQLNQHRKKQQQTVVHPQGFLSLFKYVPQLDLQNCYYLQPPTLILQTIQCKQYAPLILFQDCSTELTTTCMHTPELIIVKYQLFYPGNHMRNKVAWFHYLGKQNWKTLLDIQYIFH